jgi:hypothetical protein
VSGPSPRPARPDLPDLDIVRRVLASRAGEVVEVVALPGKGAPRARPLRLPEDLEAGVEFVRKHAGADGTVSIGVATLSQAGAERLADLHSRRRAGHSRSGEHDGYRWVVADLDPSDEVDLAALRIKLADFPLEPTLLVHSGRGLHAWWALRTPVSVEAGAQVMADLARALGGDEGTTNPTRVLRLAGTWNGKPDAQRNARIELDDLDPHGAPLRRYSAEELSSAAYDLVPRPEPSRPAPGPGDRPGRSEGPDLIAELKRDFPLAELLDALAGPRRGKAWRCPVDDHDKTASLRLVAGHEDRWICWGSTHPETVGRRHPDGHTSGDVIDLLAWQANVPQDQFLADERRRRNLPGPQTTGAQHASKKEPATSKDEHEEDTSSRRTIADQLLELFEDEFVLYRSTSNGKAFAVPREGPRRVYWLENGLGKALRPRWRHRHGRVVSGKHVKDVLDLLEGLAEDAPVKDTPLRSAQLGRGEDLRLVLDLGTPSCQAVVIDQNDWRIVDKAPLVFNRTSFTQAMPSPVAGGALEELRTLLNVTDETWPLLVAWLVAALFAEMPHPVLFLSGEQGAGKTTAGRLLAGLVDPSVAPLRSAPTNEDHWASSAASTWVVGVDNISYIEPWLSDAFCQTVTGAVHMKRKQYTDDQAHATTYRRVLLLTSIESGVPRSDLADRMLTIDLGSIDSRSRRPDHELNEQWEAMHPRLLGALLDLAVKVLQVLPQAQQQLREEGMPRLADFAEILVACDLVRGTRAMDTFRAMGTRMASEVLDNDMVASALLDFAEDHFDERRRLGQPEVWEGAPKELLAKLVPPERYSKRWPDTPAALGKRLARLQKDLRTSGLILEKSRAARGVVWTISTTHEHDLAVRSRSAEPAEKHVQEQLHDGWEPTLQEPPEAEEWAR